VDKKSPTESRAVGFDSLLKASVSQDLSATTKSPPPLSQRARGDKILPHPPAPLPKGEGRQDTPSPLGEGWGEGVKS